MLAVAPFVGLLILVGLALFMQRKASLIDSSASTSLIKQSLKGLQPVALPFAALICLVCLCAAQLISVSFFELLLISFGICGIGIAQLKLPNFLSQLINAPYASSIRSNKNVIFIRCTCIRILLIASIVGCCFLTLETPYRTEPMEIFEPYLYIQTTMIALVVLTAYFVGQQRGVGPRICVWIFACIGLAQYFVWQFKGTTILPTDLFALGTAAAVAGGYTYVFNTSALTGIVWALIGNLLCTALTEVRRIELRSTNTYTCSFVNTVCQKLPFDKTYNSNALSMVLVSDSRSLSIGRTYLLYVVLILLCPSHRETLATSIPALIQAVAKLWRNVYRVI